jgi:hypothetical protein
MTAEWVDVPGANDDVWWGAEGELDGQATSTRVRPNLQALIGDERYDRRLIVKFRYADGGDGLPDEEQDAQMLVVENALLGEFDPDRFGILAFVYTADGERAWNFYFSNLEELQERVDTAMADYPGLPLSFEACEDPMWQGYLDVLGSLQAAAN